MIINFDSSTAANHLTEVLLLGFLGFMVAMLVTPFYTQVAYTHKWWKKQRTTAITGEKASVFQKLHASKHKRNFPTMAGLIMIAATAIVTLIANWQRDQTYLPLAAMVGAGLVGLLDDLINLRGLGQGIAGLSTRLKFGFILLVSFLGGIYFYTKLEVDSMHVPFLGGAEGSIISLGWLIVPIFMLVVVSTANAVNQTDGLDGLAGGVLVNAFSAYGLIAFLQGNYGIAGFCATVVGTLLAYVWFNIYPARFMMGDVGSFALGTALAVVAMLSDAVLVLPVIGVVFVIETGSVIIQLLSKKIRKKKVFQVAPIHHHFEAIGWPESKVTMRFWVISQVAAAIGVVAAVLGGTV